MKSHDPILIRFRIWFDRTVLFVVLSAVIALAIWLYTLLVPFNVEGHNLLVWINAAWSPPQGVSLARVLVIGCLAIGLLTTVVLYLAAGLWWSKSGDVYHRRGARLDDMEG